MRKFLSSTQLDVKKEGERESEIKWYLSFSSSFVSLFKVLYFKTICTFLMNCEVKNLDKRQLNWKQWEICCVLMAFFITLNVKRQQKRLSKIEKLIILTGHIYWHELLKTHLDLVSNSIFLVPFRFSDFLNHR